MVRHIIVIALIFFTFHFVSSRKCKIIDGKEMARELKEEVKADVAKWVSLGNRRPQLTAIIVGNDPASITYVRNKMKAAAYTGM